MIQWVGKVRQRGLRAEAARYLPALAVLAGGAAVFLLSLAGERDWHPWDIFVVTFLFTGITLLYATQVGRLIGRLRGSVAELLEAKQELEHEARERERTERRIAKINECFLSFGADSAQNMQRLVALCGELMEADCAGYNRLEGDLLCTAAGWNIPPDHDLANKPEGHICYDIIRGGESRPVVVRHLQQSRYAETDPNVKPFGLQTYVGIAVKQQGKPVGSLCVVYRRDFVPDTGDEELMRLLASALGVEEERRRTEEQLRESEEKYRLLVQNQTDLVAKVSLDGTFRYVSPSFCETYGISEQELIGKKFWLIRPESDEPAKEIADLFHPPYTCMLEQRTRTKQGWRWLSWALTAVRDERGKVVDIVCVGRDITERKRAEQELRRLAMIVEQAGEGIAVADLDGNIQFVNQAWADMHGYEQADLIGRHLSMFHNEEQMKREVIPFNEKVKREGYATGEVGHVRRDGTPFPTQMIVSLLNDEEGKPAGLIGFASDITERKRAEEELEKTNRQLQQAVARANDLAVEAEKANTAKSQFLANMSHEIRTPMNAIIGMVELALDTDLTAEQREYLVTVKESAEALLGLLDDILDLAKIEAGKLELEPIDFQLRDSLGDALKALAIRAHQKGLELAFEVDTDVPDMVVGDPMRLRQIITNLVGNAIKFTREGQVVVHVAMEEESEEEVRLHFSVTDTGIGIPEDQIDKVLEPFEQADGSATRQYGGTGLGLAICRQLARAMKGRLWVESEMGEGSTFHFTVALGISKHVSSRTCPDPVRLTGMPILVVDDNATNRRIMEKLLDNWGMKPRAVGSGEEALEVIREAARSGRPFSAVLVDVHMPGMDGFALVERMRADRELGNPAVILLTSAGQRGDAARCRELGISRLS